MEMISNEAEEYLLIADGNKKRYNNERERQAQLTINQKRKVK